MCLLTLALQEADSLHQLQHHCDKRKTREHMMNICTLCAQDKQKTYLHWLDKVDLHVIHSDNDKS